jgi:integrase
VNPISTVTVGQLLDKYEAHRKRTARSPRHNLEHPDLRFVRRVRQFLEPYRDWSITAFGPDDLGDVQQALLKHEYIHGNKKKRYTRRGINDTVKWIRKIWRWGLGRQFVKPEQVQGLEEIQALRMGDTNAPDNHKRSRVTKDELFKVVEVVNSVVGDMLKLIWYTGMRPYEVCEMRPYDIVCEDPECWLYIPGRDRTPVGKHKTTRYERIKVIPLTAYPQKILAARIKDFNSKEYIFTPREAMREFCDKKSADRRTPLSCGNRPGTNRKEHPMIKPGEMYTNSSLCRACKRGCKRAGVEKFVPYDLRRTMATGTRSMLGKEAAKVLLGHAKIDTTDIYLLEEVQEAMKIAKLLASKS